MSFVDAEQLLVEALNAAPEITEHGLEAYGDVPRPRPARFITVELTGGPVERYRSIPTLAVQVWAGSRHEASQLAKTVAAWMRDVLPLDPRIGRATVNSLYNFPDPDSKTARYQITAELVTQTY